MNTALWILQILLAVVFLMTGLMKWMRPQEEIAKQMAWAQDFSQGQIRGIGLLELLGALGLILPALTGILPVLTPLAAAGLALVMVGAAITHIRRQELGMVVFNAVLFLMAVFVAYGRFAAVPL